MKWFKRKPKEESHMSEKDKPFDPMEYDRYINAWRISEEDREALLNTKSPREYDQVLGRIKYQRDEERRAEVKREEYLAAEKAKTHWAKVMLYNNPHPHEAEAARLDDFMERMHQSHNYNEFKMVPLHMFNDGVKFVRLKDIASIHFTEEYMKARASANE